MPPTRKVFVETLGCQMNKSDSELMLGLLSNEGFEIALNQKEADLLIINTCQIRGSAEDKAYSHLGAWGKFKRKNPHVKIAMAGCVAQQTKEQVFKRAPYVDIVFGTQNIQELPELVRKAFAGTDRIVAVDRQKPRSTFDYFSDVSPKRESDILAWVPIIEGCDYFCTYCVVPYTRGRQLSRPPESILREVIELGSSGFKEITLLGQTVDSYGKDFEKNPDGSYYDFATLLHEVHAIEGIERIRFMTSHPLDLNDAVIDAVATLPKVMEYIHIPMQSGDDEILAQMKRGYTRDQYFDLVDKIYDRIPGVAVTGDYIVGFPGETDAQFENSLESIKRSRIHAANTARYSARKQTPAALMEKRGMEVPEAVKEERLQIMNALINEQSLGFNKEYLGKTVEVLVEGTSKRNEARLMGRTRNNKVVNFESPFTEDELVGQIISVEVSQVFGWSLMGNHCLISSPENLSETVSNPANWVPSR